MEPPSCGTLCCNNSLFICRYERGKTLAGVLYFHRISDSKMTGVSRRNFDVFQKLCGDDALRSVVIVTNVWEEVNPDVGNQREAELMTEADFFKPVLSQGARMVRHESTILSAEKIIRLILGNQRTLPLRIQEELVKENKSISETAAGKELSRVLIAQTEKHQEQTRALREEMEQALNDKDEVRRGLEDKVKWLEGEIEGLQKDRRSLISKYERRIADIIRDSERQKARMRKKIESLSSTSGSSTLFAFSSTVCDVHAKHSEILWHNNTFILQRF